MRVAVGHARKQLEANGAGMPAALDMIGYQVCLQIWNVWEHLVAKSALWRAS